MQLACVPPDRVAEIWPHVRHWIKAAMERADISSFAQVEADALSGATLLWLATDGKRIGAVAVTDVQQTDRKICLIVACGGERMKEWLHLISGLEEYARAEGCEAMRIIGPRAWARVLEGYVEQAVVLEKVL
jgi:hypothetical protein